MDNSLSAYTQKYDKEGYGLQYPDGHVIRFYERILKYKLSKTSGKLLDFGCGNGVHSKYFKNITGGGAYIILQNKLLKKLCKNFMNYAMKELLYLQP
nr:hypothetical protein [Campylobacter jejuni]